MESGGSLQVQRSLRYIINRCTLEQFLFPTLSEVPFPSLSKRVHGFNSSEISAREIFLNGLNLVILRSIVLRVILLGSVVTARFLAVMFRHHDDSLCPITGTFSLLIYFLTTTELPPYICRISLLSVTCFFLLLQRRYRKDSCHVHSRHGSSTLL